MLRVGMATVLSVSAVPWASTVDLEWVPDAITVQSGDHFTVDLVAQAGQPVDLAALRTFLSFPGAAIVSQTFSAGAAIVC